MREAVRTLAGHHRPDNSLRELPGLVRAAILYGERLAPTDVVSISKSSPMSPKVSLLENCGIYEKLMYRQIASL